MKSITDKTINNNILEIIDKDKNKNKDKNSVNEYFLKNLTYNLSFTVLNGNEKEAIEIIDRAIEDGYGKELGEFLSQDSYFQKNVVSNFNENLAIKLHTLGFKFEIEYVKSELLKKDNSEFFEFFLKNKSWNPNTYGFKQIYKNTLYGMHSNTPISKKKAYVKYRRLMDEFIPDIKNDHNENHYNKANVHATIFIKYGDGRHLLEEEKDYISNISVDEWTNILEHMQGMIISQAYDVENKIKSIINICNDFENARRGMVELEKNLAKSEFNEFVKTWIGKNTKYEDTRFYRKAKEIINSSNLNRSDDEIHWWLEYADHRFKTNNSLGMDLHDYLLSQGRNMVSEGVICSFQNSSQNHFRLLNISCPDDMKYNNQSKVGYESLIEKLIIDGSDIQLILLQSDAGKGELFKAITKDAKNLYLWCKQSKSQNIIKTLREIKELKDWMDEYDNNIAHYIMKYSELSKTFVQSIVRINHAWFTMDNKTKVTPENILMKRRSSLNQSALVAISKDILKRSIKSNDGGRAIVKKAKKQKRTM